MKQTTNELPTISIQGKDYVLVKDRIMRFHELYPNGSIRTESVPSLSGNQWVVKATVTPDIATSERCFTGYSQAVEGQGMVNKTAALENAETSAIGRALAILGIGVIDSVASADEMNKATAPESLPWEAKRTLPEGMDQSDAEFVDKAIDADGFAKVDESDLTGEARSTCPMHGAIMIKKHGQYGDFWTHGKKLADGTWQNCNGKGWK